MAKGAHPKYIDMVVAAIKAQGEKSGSSRQAINKYIVKEFKLTENKHHLAMLKQALKRGSAGKGPIVHNKGKGAAGSFKLNTALPAAKQKAKSSKKKASKVTKKKAVKKGAKKAPKAKTPTPAVTEPAEKKPAKSAKTAKAKSPVKGKAKTASKAASPKKPKAKKSPKKGPARKIKK